MSYSETWWKDGMAAVLAKWGPQIDWALEQLPEQPPWLTRGLVAARVWYETRGVSHVTSADPVLKEKGLLQLSADSVAQYGIDPFDPESNLRAGVDQWTKWARAVDTWCRANGIKGQPELDQVDGAAVGWLVTSIGPGASKWLAKRTGELSALRWQAEPPETFSDGERTGAFGRQTAQKVRDRITVALEAGRAALFTADGLLMTAVALVGIIWSLST